MTEYERSNKAGHDLLTSLQEEPKDPKAELLRIGKTAFRAAYEYFQEMLPVENTEDYWVVAAKHANEWCFKCENSGIAQALMAAVFYWLETQANEQRKQNSKGY